MEEEEYTLGDYFNGVQQRLENLSEKEVSTLNRFKTSPQGQVLKKVLDEELMFILSSNDTTPKKRGLAART